MNHTKAKNWKGLLLVALLCVSLTALIPFTSVKAARQISGSETWTGNVQLSEDIHVMSGGKLIVDGATVKFDDGVWGDPNPGPNWYCVKLYGSAQMLVKNGADLNDTVKVWFGGSQHDQWLGRIECYDNSILNVQGSSVGSIHDRDSATVTTDPTSRVHRFYHITEQLQLPDDTVITLYTKSAIKPDIQGTVDEIYYTLSTSATTTISGSSLGSGFDVSVNLLGTAVRKYIWLDVSGSGQVTITNPPTDSHIGVFFNLRTMIGSTAKITCNDLSIDLSQEPIDRQVGLTSLQTSVQAFGTGVTGTQYYENANLLTGIDSTGESVWVRDSWVQGVWYHNNNPELWAKFGAGHNNFLGWFNPFPSQTPTGIGMAVAYLSDNLVVDKIWVSQGILYIRMTVTVECHNQVGAETDYVSYFWNAQPAHGRFNNKVGTYPFFSSLIIRKWKATDPNFKQCTVTWSGSIPDTTIEIGCHVRGNGFTQIGDAMLRLHPNMSYQLTENTPAIPLTER